MVEIEKVPRGYKPMCFNMKNYGIFAGRVGLDFGPRSFEADLSVKPSGANGAVSLKAGKIALERATWAFNRVSGSAQIRLRLPARDTEFDLDYRGRRLSVRVTKAQDGVERWGSEMKLSLRQPSFNFELRENGKAPQTMSLVFENGLWKVK